MFGKVIGVQEGDEVFPELLVCICPIGPPGLKDQFD